MHKIPQLCTRSPLLRHLVDIGQFYPRPVMLPHWHWGNHHNDVIMGALVSQITSLTIVYWTVYSRRRSRKNQSPASQAFVRGNHRWPVNSPHKGPVTRQMFPFDDVIMHVPVLWRNHGEYAWIHHTKLPNILISTQQTNTIKTCAYSISFYHICIQGWF